MPQSTNFISMSQQCGGLCICHKMGELVGYCMMVCKTFCYKFFECKLLSPKIIYFDSMKNLTHAMKDMIITNSLKAFVFCLAENFTSCRFWWLK